MTLLQVSQGVKAAEPCVSIMGERHRWPSLLLLPLLLASSRIDNATGTMEDNHLAHSIRSEFELFLQKHDKVYHDQLEWESRLMNYMKAKRFLADFQRRSGPSSFEVNLNHLSDLHEHELQGMGPAAQWQQHNDSQRLQMTATPDEELQLLASAPFPKALNWASDDNPLGRSIVSRPQNQRHCGACWAFVAANVVESAVAASTGRLTPLSVQQLVDCDTRWNAGCLGGNPIQAYDYIETAGLSSAESYPYVAEKKDCPTELLPVSAIRTYRLLRSYDEDSLLAAVVKQPVAVGIAGQYPSFLYYAGGVYDDENCGTELNHALVITGYGTDSKTGKDFWIAKNSWGEGWGEGGYVRLLRKVSGGPGVCGLATAPSIPVGAWGGNLAGLAHPIKGFDNDEESVQWPTLGQLLPALIGISLLIGLASGYLVSTHRNSRIRAAEGRGFSHPYGQIAAAGGGYGVYYPTDQQRRTYSFRRAAVQEVSSSSTPSSNRGGGGDTPLTSFPPAVIVTAPTMTQPLEEEYRSYGSMNM